MPYVSLKDYVVAVRSGHIVALPTDTVLGLGVAPDHSAKLYKLKQRSLDKPLILMGANAADLWPYVRMDMTQWQTMTERYWPGQLTLVVPASAKVPPVMHPKTPDSIGVRVPDHAIARHLIALTGPLATTSANLSGQPTLINVEQVLAQFPQVYGLSNQSLQTLLTHLGPEAVMPLSSGLPSTVVRWHFNHWQTIRQGTVYL